MTRAASLLAAVALAAAGPAAATDYAIASLAGAQVTVMERADAEGPFRARTVPLPDPVIDMAALEAVERVVRANDARGEVLWVELDRVGAPSIGDADARGPELASLRSAIAKSVQGQRSERLVLVLPARAAVPSPVDTSATGLGLWTAHGGAGAAVPDAADGLFANLRVEIVDATNGTVLADGVVSVAGPYPAGADEIAGRERGLGAAPVVRALASRVAREIDRVVPPLLSRAR